MSDRPFLGGPFVVQTGEDYLHLFDRFDDRETVQFRLLQLGRPGGVLALIARQFFDYPFSFFSECGLALFEGPNLILKAFYPLCRLLPPQSTSE